MKAMRSKETKSRCDAACKQLLAAKELLNMHDIALGAANVGSSTDKGQRTLVRFLPCARTNAFLQCNLACSGCGGVLQYDNSNFQQAFTALMHTFTTSALC